MNNRPADQYSLSRTKHLTSHRNNYSKRIFEHQRMKKFSKLDISWRMAFSLDAWNKTGGSPCSFFRNCSVKVTNSILLCIFPRGHWNEFLPILQSRLLKFRNFDFYKLDAYFSWYLIHIFLRFSVLLLQNRPVLSFFMIPALKAAAILDVSMFCAVEVRNAKPGNHLKLLSLPAIASHWSNKPIGFQKLS